MSMPVPSAGYWVIALSIAAQTWSPSNNAMRMGRTCLQIT
jgi:hypothetical protein